MVVIRVQDGTNGVEGSSLDVRGREGPWRRRLQRSETEGDDLTNGHEVLGGFQGFEDGEEAGVRGAGEPSRAVLVVDAGEGVMGHAEVGVWFVGEGDGEAVGEGVVFWVEEEGVGVPEEDGMPSGDELAVVFFCIDMVGGFVVYWKRLRRKEEDERLDIIK